MTEISDAKLRAEGVTKEQLLSYITRIEQLELEKAELAADIKEIFAEAKAHGYDTKIMKKCISLRKKDRADIQEEQAILALYLQALGENIDITAA